MTERAVMHRCPMHAKFPDLRWEGFGCTCRVEFVKCREDESGSRSVVADEHREIGSVATGATSDCGTTNGVDTSTAATATKRR